MLKDKYDHKISEKFWQNYWKDKKIYAWKNDKAREETFVIDTPPPTVSGFLHMGHVFSYTQADFVARFQRMNGKDVFYPMGFDDNGLPTERLVEKVKNIRVGAVSENAAAHDPKKPRTVSRDEFVRECQSVVDEAELEFEALFNAIALSVDWSQKYQTISPQSQKLSQASFVDLYRKGLIERKFEPVLWDCVDQTALSQADLVDKEVPSSMNEIEFALEDSTQKIIIMTTRPELLPACVAVMVHPDDERYKKFHGQNAVTALFGVKVPIITDEDVKMDKGTGAVMCCTFGDETDIKWWKSHNLQLRVILQKNGKFSWSDFCNIGTSLTGDLTFDSKKFVDKCEEIYFKKNDQLSVESKNLKQAREKILEELKAQNLLLKSENFTHVVKTAERSGAPIEIVVTPQWFVKILDKKEELKRKAQECNWFPEYMRVRIEQWIDGLSWDWCISRQRFFGVPFPAWYSKRQGEEGKILVADIEQLPCDPLTTAPKGYTMNEVTPETDIMDTWATSSITPQLSSHAINSELNFGELDRHNKLFPADMRPQAHEIIRTWAFYTIVKAHLHQNSIPWKNLMISGWCLAADKTKMSKSKGNIVTPTTLVEEKGSDVVRYFASNSHLGADTAYSEEVFKLGQRLITKLYNAAKFAAMNFSEIDLTKAARPALAQIESGDIFETADLWILSRLHETIKQATASFEKFEYARAREKIEEFFWKDFCDNYLELIKVRAYGLKAEKLADVEFTDAQKQELIKKQHSAINSLYVCLNALLKLFAPFIPHLTEELYANIFADEFAQTTSVNARGNWPKLQDHHFSPRAYEVGNAALEVIFEVRRFKSDNNLSMKTTVAKIEVAHATNLAAVLQDLENVCNAKEIEFKQSEELKVVVMQ